MLIDEILAFKNKPGLTIVILFYYFMLWLFQFIKLFYLFQFPGGGPPGGLAGLPGMPGGIGPRLDMPPAVSMASMVSRQEHLMSIAASSAAAAQECQQRYQLK